MGGKMQKPEAQTADALPTLQEPFTPANLRGNATPRFFSGDNPIVVTTGALLALCIVAASARLGQGHAPRIISFHSHRVISFLSRRLFHSALLSQGHTPLRE